jgi:hypothetical protein
MSRRATAALICSNYVVLQMSIQMLHLSDGELRLSNLLLQMRRF